MKTKIILTLVFGACFLSGCVAPTNTVSPVGTWQLVKGGGVHESRSRFKLITDTHYTCIELDNTTKKLHGMHGGTYSLLGETFSESIEFSDSNWQQLVNMKSDFKIRQTGDTLTFLGNFHNEVWQRVPGGINNAIDATHKAPAVKKTPVPAEVSSELSEILSRNDFEITIKEQFMSPEGDIILKLGENTFFAKGATIKIASYEGEGLGLIAQKIIICTRFNRQQISEGKNLNKIKSVELNRDNSASVRLE